jgi:hypothetical protein
MGAGAAALRAPLSTGGAPGPGPGAAPDYGPQATGTITLESGTQLILPAEVPPPGCSPDAYKLFIGNVPKSYTEEVCRASGGRGGGAARGPGG